jgi:hypothetical protein
MPGSLTVLGPDGPNINFSLVDLDGEAPYLSEMIDISITNTGDTALTHLEIGDAAETGHLELSVDRNIWTPSIGFNTVLMPGQSKSLYARASFSDEDEEGVSEIKIAAQARSVPVEVAQLFNSNTHG